MRIFSLYTSQFRAIIFKQYVDMIQGGWLMFFLRFSLPLILVLVLYLKPLVAISRASDTLLPDIWSDADMGVPKCFAIDDADGRYGFGTLIPQETRTCKTIGFYPINSYTQKIMRRVAEQSNLDFNMDFQPFSSRVEADATLLRNPKKFTFMVGFEAPFEVKDAGGQTRVATDKEVLSNLSILINYNQTLLSFPNFYAFYLRDKISTHNSLGLATTVPLRVQMALGRAILLESEGIGVDFYPRLAQLPFSGRKSDLQVPDKFMSNIFIVTVICMQFLVTVSNAIAEKDSGRFESLRLMGVNDCIYILAVFSFQLVIFILTWLPYFIIAYMMPGGTDVYRWIDPLSFLLYNLISSASVTIFGLFFSSFIGTIRLGMSIGFVMVACAFIEVMVFTLASPERVYDQTFISSFWMWLLQIFFPFTPIILTALQMVATAFPTSGANPRTFEPQLIDPTDPWTLKTWFSRGNVEPCLVQPKGSGLKCTYRPLPPITNLLILLLDTLLYFFITWFISEAIPSHSSLCRKPWELFKKDYWSTAGEGYTLSSIADDRETRYRRILAKRHAYKKAGLSTPLLSERNQDEDDGALHEEVHGSVIERAPHVFRITVADDDGHETPRCIRFNRYKNRSSESDVLDGRQPVPSPVFEAVLRSLLPLDRKVSAMMRRNMMSPTLKNTVLVTHHIQKTFVRTACSGSREDKNKVGRYHYALRGLTLNINYGQIFGLLGQNGAGKSTSINCIIGSLRPDKPPKRLMESFPTSKNPCIGNGWIDDYSIRYQMNHIRRKLGICPQHNTTLWPGLTPTQHLKLVCLLHNIPEFEIPLLVEKHLRQVALYEYRDKPCKHFSGGMQRRLCIAIATCGYHKLLLFDEATTGTDPETKRIVWSAIRKTSRSKMSVPVVTGSVRGKDLQVKRIYRPPPGILLTSHDMAEVDYLSDEIAIMSSGKIIASGTSLELKRLYGSGYQLTIISSSTRSTNILSELIKCWLQQNYPEIEYVSHKADINDFLYERTRSRINILNQTGQSIVYSINLLAEYAIPGFIQFIEFQKTNSYVTEDNYQTIARDIYQSTNLDSAHSFVSKSVEPLVKDYQLDGTTLEEVFLRLGKIYQAGVLSQLEKYTSQQETLQDVRVQELLSANSGPMQLTGDSHPNKMQPQTSSQPHVDDLLIQQVGGADDSTELSDPAIIRYAKAEDHDALINGEEIHLDKFSPEVIKNVLNPRRARPRIFTALIAKMLRYDLSAKMGVFSAFFLPIILITLGWVLADIFVPWLINLVSVFAERVTVRSGSACSACRLLKSIGGFGYIENCFGYDAFGNPMACPNGDRYTGAVNVEPVVWIGGGTISEPETPDFLPNGTATQTTSLRYSNIMQRRPGTGRIYVFDQSKRFGTGVDNTVILQDSFRGHRTTYTYNLTLQNTTIPISSVDYDVFTVMGQPVTPSIKAQVSIAVESFMKTKFSSLFPGLPATGSTNYLDYISIKPTAVPVYTSATNSSDDFQLKPDLAFADGYSTYNKIDTLIREIIFMQSRNGIPKPNDAVYFDVCYNNPQLECGKKIRKLVYVDPTNLALLQQYYNYVLEKVPLAILDFDAAGSYTVQDGVTTIRPVIYSYFPAKLGSFIYKRLALKLKFNMTSINNRIKELGIKNITSMPGVSDQSYIAPPSSKAPSIIIDSNLLDTRSIFIHNEVHARLVEAIARASYGISPAESYMNPASSINIRFGYQPWDWKWTFPITMGQDKMKVMFALIMIALACMSMVPMHMFPVVLDRQQGLRQMFKLNGVPTWLYWCTNFVYQLCLALLVYTVMIILGYFVFRLSLLRKMDIAIIFLVFSAGAYGQLTTAFLFSLLFPNTQLSTLFGNITIIVLAVVLLIEGDVQTESLLWWYFFTPMMSFATLLGFVGWSAQDFQSFMHSPMRWLVLGMWVEGTLFFGLTIYLDYVIPRESNGVPLPWNFIFTGCRRKRSFGAATFNYNNKELVPVARDPSGSSVSGEAEKGTWLTPGEGSSQPPPGATLMTSASLISCISTAENDALDTSYHHPGIQSNNFDSGIGCGIEEEMGSHEHHTSMCVRPPINVQLNAMPEYRGRSLPPPKTNRDYAIRTGQAEMDIDVLAERQYMYNGIKSNTPVIVCNLQKFYPPSFVAVRDVSFHLPRSTCFAFLGSNGAGKSTTISMMTGLIKPTKGTVILNGWDVRHDSNEIYKSIGLCPQHDAYIPILSVRDHLMLFARLHGVPKEDEKSVVERLASFVYLHDVLDRQARQLSGGMRRRLSLALALIG